MASQISQEAERKRTHMPDAVFTPSGLERFKLDRLRELRAVITSLRLENEQATLAPHLELDDVRFGHAR